MKKGMRFYGNENFGDGLLCVRMKKAVEPDGEIYVVGVGFVGLSRADKMPGVMCEEEESGARIKGGCIGGARSRGR
jgi:hypothetical protein